MMEQFGLLQQLTTSLTPESTREMLIDMILKGYRMIGVFEGELCLGISGIWIGTKLYSGKYLEIDNFVTDSKYRSKGIGKMLTDHIEKMAREENCQCIMLDAYAVNTAAHRFYFREGYLIRGFHFIKEISV